MEELKYFIVECFKSFGFKGRRKTITINNKKIWLYYYSFSGKWGYSDKEYTTIDQIDIIPIKHRFGTERKAFNFLKKIIEN